jgi:hypothetical protein
MDSLKRWWFERSMTNVIVNQHYFSDRKNQTIGIISDIADIEAEAGTIKSNFTGRTAEVVTLYYSENGSSENANYFGKKDIKWPGIPKSSIVEEVLQKQFDICFFLFNEENLPNEYLLRSTKSAFKLGIYHQKFLPYLDFAVEIPADHSTKKMIKELLDNANKLRLTA